MKKTLLKYPNKEQEFDTEDFYLEYLNDFLTVQGIADHYGISDSQAKMLIDCGRQINHNRTDRKFLNI